MRIIILSLWQICSLKGHNFYKSYQRFIQSTFCIWIWDFFGKIMNQRPNDHGTLHGQTGCSLLSYLFPSTVCNCKYKLIWWIVVEVYRNKFDYKKSLRLYMTSSNKRIGDYVNSVTIRQFVEQFSFYNTKHGVMFELKVNSTWIIRSRVLRTETSFCKE